MKGHFVSKATGEPEYYGRRASRADLEATHEWIEGGETPRVHNAEKWDGAKWAASPEREAELDKRSKREELAKLEQKLAPIVIALIDTLVLRGVIAHADLPPAVLADVTRIRTLQSALR